MRTPLKSCPKRGSNADRIESGSGFPPEPMARLTDGGAEPGAALGEASRWTGVGLAEATLWERPTAPGDDVTLSATRLASCSKASLPGPAVRGFDVAVWQCGQPPPQAQRPAGRAGSDCRVADRRATGAVMLIRPPALCFRLK
jgi:hypothetical protein